MPKVGRIDIPDILWNALVEDAAREFAEMTFVIGRKQGLDLAEASSEPGLISDKTRDHFDNCVVALIRMQTGDFYNDDQTIRTGDDWQMVYKAAQMLGDQKSYNALSSDKQLRALKALVDANWQYMTTDLPHP